MDAATNEVKAETAPADDGFEWCAVEVFGHRAHVGRAREEERFGSKMMRVDALTIKGGVDTWETLYYGGGSIFSYRPVTEDVARKVAKRFYPVAPQITSRTNDGDEFYTDEGP